MTMPPSRKLHIYMLLGVLAVGLPASHASARDLAPPAGLPAGNVLEEYRLGPQDKIDVNVYQVKDLTVEGLQIDSAGNIFLPLIGRVAANGLTPSELANEIAARLRGQYLQEPQVSVSVREAISQKVTVDGAVVQPGVYAMSGPTTLLQAVAMAKGADNKYANLKRVTVFRTVEGQRQAAVFDLKEIRAGRAADPIIRSNDVIVVDGSGVKGVWREIIGSIPVLSIFRPY
jgi:polysaccharide export outer membrane protein